MRFAFVRLPDGPFEIVMQKGERARIFVIGRGKQIAVLLALLLCAAALFASTHLTNDQSDVASTPAYPPVEPRAMAQALDGSRPLRVGDHVIMDGTSAPKIRQVAAAPNETVLLRRGNALQALYILGESSYVVVSENESRLARPEEIRASMASATLAVVR